MAGDIKSLKSYLVSLGFDVNTAQLGKFNSALNSAKSLVKSSTFEMSNDLLKWGTAATGVLAAISGAVVGTIAKVATADQDFRLFGQRMFLNTQQARSLKIALDALGQPLEAIAFDPELHARYEQLRKDQIALSGGLGGDFEGTMKQIRDVMFEFTRLKVEFQYFTMSVAKDIFQALGGGDFIQRLHSLNDYIIQHIPEWSQKFTTYLLPVLKATWHILEDIGIILIKLEPLFLAVLQSVGWILDKIMPLIDFIANHPGLIGGAALGAKVGSFAGPEGALIGGGLGALGGAAYDAATGGAAKAPAANSGGSGGSTDARRLAARVGADLGIDPSIIYAQWAHETGNFTNRGATSLNNLAGINVPGGHGQDYRSFGSLDQFGDYYEGLIRRRYSSALGAKDVDQFALALKQGGYYGDSFQNYDKGMRHFQGAYGGGSSSPISVGTINIMQPNATPDQIKNAVRDGINEHVSLNTKRSLSQTRSVIV